MRPEWMDDGLCAQIGGDDFFPERGSSETARIAKLICNGNPRRGIEPCPVRERCLQWALDTGERFGVWGGLSERERRQLPGGAA